MADRPLGRIDLNQDALQALEGKEGPEERGVPPSTLAAPAGPVPSTPALLPLPAASEPSEYRFLHFPPEAVRVGEDRLAALPASAQRVFAAIRDLGPVPHGTLRQATGMPDRTIRFAVQRLKDAGLIDARCSLKDCRTRYFFVSRPFIATEALERARHQAELASQQGVNVVKAF